MKERAWSPVSVPSASLWSNAFGCNESVVILAVFCFVFGPWTCCVQTEAVTSSMQEGFGISPLVTVILIGITCLLTIWGGLKRISAVMSKVVPIMAVLYVAAGLGVVIMNFQQIPVVIVLIFRSAFTPTPAAGGFAGATVRDAVQYGIARGVYSNDAGTGYGIIAHASAKTDHPVRQSLWGWDEVLIFRLLDDFWQRYEPAKECGENPPIVTFDCSKREEKEV